ncbi:MAG TPA: lipoprotein-releasing ABC transporter permease subunit [Burkholderiales bacterium]
MPYELLVGLRYTGASRSNRFISFISLISMLGIALGVAALIVVLSVMNGFETELRARILGVVAHLQITGPGGQLADWPGVAGQASRNPEVVAAAPFVDAQGMISTGAEAKGALVRGIEPGLEAKVADIGTHMTAGALDELAPGSFRIVLGAELARALGVKRGDRVMLMMPRGESLQSGLLPALRQLTVSGIFDLGMYEYDSTLALVNLRDAQSLYGLGDRVSGVRLKLADLLRSRDVAEDLVRRIDRPLYIYDWSRSHANFFRAIQSQKSMMFLILLLIVAVAAFNIVATLVMIVTDKQPDIAVLRTLGASPFSVMKVFVVQGTLIGVIGTLIGVAAGIVLALNVGAITPVIERLLDVRLDPSIYYISELPSDLRHGDVAAVALVSLALSLLATLYPSWRASKLNPADALRYE